MSDLIGKIYETTSSTIRFRAVLLGLFFTVVICAATPFNNAYRQATPLGGGHFPLAPFFIFIWLTLFMAIWGKFFTPKSVPSAIFDTGNLNAAPPPVSGPNFKLPLFTGKELLLAWIQMVIGSGIAYTGLARTFFFTLTVPFRFATPENRWQEVIQPLMPSALYPTDLGSVTLLYTGLEKGREMTWLAILQNIPWNIWLPPLLIWGGFILLCYFVMLCLINVLSRQWIHNEHMNFPLLRVPQMLSEAIDSRTYFPLLSNGFLLSGMVIPLLLHTLNGFHFYFPSVPQIPTLVLAGPYFPEYGIFSGFHKLKIYFYPAFIGFAFITSRQISFSFWFMFVGCGVLTGLLSIMGYNIPASALGITFGPTLTMPEEMQMIGAYGIFFLFLIWLSKAHLGEVFSAVFNNLPFRAKRGAEKEGERRLTPWFFTRPHPPFIASRPDMDSPSHPEWFSASWSAWGSMLGLFAIILWLTFFEMPLKASLLLVGAFFMIMIVASRIIAQGGVAYFTLTAAPVDGLLTFFGPGFFTASGILLTGVVQKMLFLDMRESLMPSLLQAAKVHETVKAKRTILIGIVSTLIVSIMVSFASMLALCHKYGLREIDMEWASRTTISVYDNIFQLIDNPVSSGDWVMIFSIAGAVVMLILVLCYQRFYWWPLHPLGYLTAYSSAMRILWFSFFLGWLFNALCVRYGGVLFFKKIRLFFIGLIIGDFLMGGIWAVAGFFTEASYQVLPG